MIRVEYHHRLRRWIIDDVASFNVPPSRAPEKHLKQVSTPENEAAYFAQARGILIGPYLTATRDMATTIGVAWVTDTEEEGLVELGIDRAGERSIREGGPAREHFVLLTGLQPGTRYRYRIRTGELASKEYSFRTSPPDGKCRILIGSDWHFRPFGNPSYQSQLDYFALSYPRMIEAAPDVVLLQGDNCESSLSAWYNLFDTCRDLFASSVVILVMGNHEIIDKAVLARFIQMLHYPSGADNDSFVYGRVHMAVALMPAEMHKACAATEEEVDWRIFNWHRPLVLSHTAKSGPSPLHPDWSGILAKYPVDFALYGHRHQYERTFPVRPNPHEPADWGIIASADPSEYVNVRGATIYLQSGSMLDGFTHAIADLYHAPRRGIDYADPDWQTFSVIDFDGWKCRFTTFGANRKTGQSQVLDQFTIDNTPGATDRMPKILGAPQVEATGYEAVISFNTDIPAKAMVRFGKEEGSCNLIASPEDVMPVWATQHTIQLNCLEPSTTYHYRAVALRGDQQAVSDELTFTTGPAAPGMVVGKFDFGFVAYGAAAGAVKDAGHTLRPDSWFGWDRRAETMWPRIGDGRAELGAAISDEFADELACMTPGATWTARLPNGAYTLEIAGGGNKTCPARPYRIIVQENQAELLFDQPNEVQRFSSAVTITTGALKLRLEADPNEDGGSARVTAITIKNGDNER